MDYLEKNLLPLILAIKPKKMSSPLVANFLNLDRVSTQSILISLGTCIEPFWNKVVSDSDNCKNLIETNNRVRVNGKNRQIDHHFETAGGIKYYCESKANLNVDTEKDWASNLKVNDVGTALNADHSAYFCPFSHEIPRDWLTKYNKRGIQVYGVKWLLSVVNAEFTSEDYFGFGNEVIAPILEEKGF